MDTYQVGLDDLSLYLHQFYVCVQAVNVLMMLRIGTGASEQCLIKYSISSKSLMSHPISLQSSHFILKDSGSSLISNQNKIRLMAFNRNL